MDNNVKRQVKTFLIPYLRSRLADFKMVRNKIKCPYFHKHENKNEELTCHEFPEGSGNLYCFSPSCGKLGNVIDLARHFDFDDNPDIPEEDIAQFLIDEFGIKINAEQNKLFDLYEKLGFDCVPVNRNGKESFIEENWQNKSHRNRLEWEQWLKAKRNIGVKTGKLSNILILDFDFVESKLKERIYAGNPTEAMLLEARRQWEEGIKKLREKVPFLDWETLQQQSFGGIHFFYVFDEEVPKTWFDYEGVHIDIEAEGGQVVIESSVVGGQKRQIIGDKINPLPKELKKFILENYNKKNDNLKKEEITPDTELTFENLNSNRNNTFCALYGKLRKVMPIKSATYALSLFNGLLDKQVPQKELRLMAKEAEKYHSVDIQTISDQIINHFNVVKDVLHVRDLKDIIIVERKDLEEALRYLQDEKKILKIKKDTYQLVADVEWKTDFLTLNKPLDYKVPYVGDYAIFNRGSMLVFGGKTGTGKTTITVNFIEQFVKQAIKPKLITTEADSGVGEIALCRGLKEGDFLYYQTSDPLGVPFQDDEVRIIDWLTPKNGDYTQIGTIYQTLNDKLVDHGGLLIVFSQLKANGDFFAPNLIDQYASLSGKFLYPEKNGQLDYLHPYLELCKMRRPKGNQKYIQIPFEYIPETKELRIKK